MRDPRFIPSPPSKRREDRDKGIRAKEWPIIYVVWATRDDPSRQVTRTELKAEFGNWRIRNGQRAGNLDWYFSDPRGPLYRSNEYSVLVQRGKKGAMRCSEEGIVFVDRIMDRVQGVASLPRTSIDQVIDLIRSEFPRGGPFNERLRYIDFRRSNRSLSDIITFLRDRGAIEDFLVFLDALLAVKTDPDYVTGPEQLKRLLPPLRPIVFGREETRQVEERRGDVIWEHTRVEEVGRIDDGSEGFYRLLWRSGLLPLDDFGMDNRQMLELYATKPSNTYFWEKMPGSVSEVAVRIPRPHAWVLIRSGDRMHDPELVATEHTFLYPAGRPDVSGPVEDLVLDWDDLYVSPVSPWVEVHLREAIEIEMARRSIEERKAT